MAPVIWGLDLAEIKWSKFKSGYMWNADYHLRKTKFIVYQLALIFCVVSESLGTAVLSDYIDGQKKVRKVSSGRYGLHNDDYVAAGSYNIFAGVFVAFILGAAFFFDLFWPERKESRGVRTAWKICGVLATIFHLASALTITIITATHQATITPGDQDTQARLWSQYAKYKEAPLSYKHNPRALAAVVFAWLGFCSVAPSCVLLFMSIDNTEKGPGPKSKHTRERDNMEAGHDDSSEPDLPEKSMDEPVRAHLPDPQHDDSAAHPSPAAEYHPGYDSERQTPVKQIVRNKRLSSIMDEDSPSIDDSEMTDSSTFSALASAKKGSTREARRTQTERRRTLGERSLAALTSGVADSGWTSR